jgi:hypothetical protein
MGNLRAFLFSKERRFEIADQQNGGLETAAQDLTSVESRFQRWAHHPISILGRCPRLV